MLEWAWDSWKCLEVDVKCPEDSAPSSTDCRVAEIKQHLDVVWLHSVAMFNPDLAMASTMAQPPIYFFQTPNPNASTASGI